MARELVTHIWCDVCLSEHDQQVGGEETPPIQIGSMKPRVMALCSQHRKLFDEFKELLADVGQVTDTPQPQPAGRRRTREGKGGVSPLQPPYVCRVPGCPSEGEPFANRGSLSSHIRQIHDMLTGTYAQQYLHDSGDPTLDLGDGPDVKRAECPTCGKVYEWPDCPRPTQALGAHRAAAHGTRGKKHAQAS